MRSSVEAPISRPVDNKSDGIGRALSAPAAGGAWCCATKSSGVGDLDSDDLLSWVTECVGIDGTASSIDELIGGATLMPEAATWGLSSDDEAACGGAVGVSASGTTAVAGGG